MKKNILVFPCGSEIGLEIHNALKYVKGFTLYGASSVADHGKYVYRNYIEGLPHIDSESFLKAINEVIEEYEIDYIFPAHDSAVLKLAQVSEKLGADVITSVQETCELCRSKEKTYLHFQGDDFIPEMFQNPSEVKEFPVFLKPDVGQGSQGIAMAKNSEELEFHLSKNEGLLTLEYLPGKEYTVDCFTDRHGELRFTGMRERHRIKSGISVNSMSLKIKKQVEEIARRINAKMNLRGMWFFQVKEAKDGSFKLLEIAPRVAGTMSLYRNKGVNFPLLSLFDRMNFDVDIIENDFEIEVDRALINRFKLNISYDCVYIDFDDTITLNEKINPYIMMFIYQCVSKDIELILITKHIHQIMETLTALKIDSSIFKEIIHIKKDEEKHTYIQMEKTAIFIDDSYAERKEIKEKHGIPVFDVDALESLIDWRN